MAGWLDGLEAWLQGLDRPSADLYICAYLAAPELEGASSDQEDQGAIATSTPAYPVKNIGAMPAGAQFGSDMMFHAFAAIPVRDEWAEEAASIVEYLSWLIAEIGLFGKIVITQNFPYGDITLPNGRWFPVSRGATTREAILYQNAYHVTRQYGGSEEGDWWYDVGRPTASVPFLKSHMASRFDSETEVPGVLDWMPDEPGVKFRARSYLRKWGVEKSWPESKFAAPYPQKRPRYE